MGDRGSISVFKKDTEWDGVSKVILFRHWGGSPESMLDLVRKAKESLSENDLLGGRIGRTPYTRLEAPAVMALLISIAVESDNYSAYVGSDTADGDNSDNGHYILDIDNWQLAHNGVRIEPLKQ